MIASVEGPFVPMTPDGSVVWNRVRLPSRESTYYISPDAPLNIIEALDADYDNPKNYLGGGSYGRVGKAELASLGPVAVKYFSDCAEYASKLPVMQVNVCLQRGLANLGKEAIVGGLKFTAPEQLLLEIPDGKYKSPRWIMEYVDGYDVTDSFELPNRMTRRELYEKALRTCGHSSHGVFFDDYDPNYVPSNIMRERGSKTVYKIDLMTDTLPL